MELRTLCMLDKPSPTELESQLMALSYWDCESGGLSFSGKSSEPMVLGSTALSSARVFGRFASHVINPPLIYTSRDRIPDSGE